MQLGSRCDAKVVLALGVINGGAVRRQLPSRLPRLSAIVRLLAPKTASGSSRHSAKSRQCRSMANAGAKRLLIGRIRPELRMPNAAGQTRIVSRARIRLGS